MRRAAFAALAAGLFLVPACGDSTGPGAPVPGVLDLRLTTPNPGDGAILFEVSGGPIDAVESAGFRLSSARLGPNEVRVIVTGSLATGTLVAQLRVPDRRRSADYAATVQEVAERSTYALRSPSGYRIDVSGN